MKNTIEITYEEALDLALPYYCRFYDLSDRYNAEKVDHSAEWCEWKLKTLEKYASMCCTAIEMVQGLFNVDEERVHEDLRHLRLFGELPR